MTRPISEQRKSEAQKVTIIGAILDTCLGFAKIIIGLLSNSSALVADGIHSFSDLLTDFVVVFVFHISSEEPDENHPWGHGRFETIGTVILGGVLIAIAGAMAFDSILNLINSQTLASPTWPALVVAGLSILSKEWIFRYTLATGKRLKSDLLIANAWHSRTDSFSSIVVLIGIIGTMAGISWFDAVAAIAVACFVAKIGGDLTWASIKELVDTSLPEERVQAFKETAQSIDGIINVHSFKSRNMGGKSQLEMHIQVAPYLSASEGHWLGDLAVMALLQRFDDIGHVIFHIDTYNDEEEHFCRILPLRAEVQNELNQHLANIAPHLKDYYLTLHYHHDLIEIDLKLPDTGSAQLALDKISTRDLSQQLNAALSSTSWFAELTVWQH